LLANEEFLVADLADEIARRRRSARARQL